MQNVYLSPLTQKISDNNKEFLIRFFLPDGIIDWFEVVNAIEEPNKVKHIKMKVIANLKAETIDKEVAQCIDNTSTITTDTSSSHVHLKDNFTEYKSQVILPQDIEKILPWVHMVISNAKSLLTDMYHGIKADFLQGYLNEFCYKKMFGEYCICTNDKPVLLICDNTVYVKMLPCIEDSDLTQKVIRLLEQNTSLPKPRKKKQ